MTLLVTTADVRRLTPANQQAHVITGIFTILLSKETLPTFLRTATILPVPKKSAVSTLNDYHPVALTPTLVKRVEKLVVQHIKDNIPASLDAHLYAFRTSRSTEDAISTALDSVSTQLENKSSSIRMLFVDFSSALNTISPIRLIGKLQTLGLTATLCKWIFRLPNK